MIFVVEPLGLTYLMMFLLHLCALLEFGHLHQMTGSFLSDGVLFEVSTYLTTFLFLLCALSEFGHLHQ